MAAAVTAAAVAVAVTAVVVVVLPTDLWVRMMAALVAMIYGVYWGFALRGATVVETAVEGSFIALGVGLAVLGAHRPVWLAAGLALHGLWDLLHHPRRHVVGTPGVPRWYVPFCALYDVGAAIVVYVAR